MNLKFAIFFVSLLISSSVYPQNVEDYYNVIMNKGKEPVMFIEKKINTHDLIIFDDALHSAVEPFDFYCEYLEKKFQSIDYVFLEVIPITAQVYIDSFLNSESKDTTILAEVFQQDFRYGWPYETYLTLFSKVWDINKKLSKEERIRIIGVDQPIYWEGLHTREDYNLFQETLITRDYFMYKTILKYMDKFSSEKKGLFLTNTRHAYKGIKNKKGEFYWNTGTFFHQWHVGKTYAVRFHNMILFIESIKQVENPTIEGLDQLVYKWVRMNEGL